MDKLTVLTLSPYSLDLRNLFHAFLGSGDYMTFDGILIQKLFGPYLSRHYVQLHSHLLC